MSFGSTWSETEKENCKTCGENNCACESYLNDVDTDKAKYVEKGILGKDIDQKFYYDMVYKLMMNPKCDITDLIVRDNKSYSVIFKMKEE